MLIKLYDGSNYYRAALETDTSGLTSRGLFVEAFRATGPEIWVWDQKGNNDRRRAVYPDYKMQRKPQTDDIRAALEFFREVMKHSPAAQVSVPGYEGDDVVATLARKYAREGHQVLIYSNDFDYYQLSGTNILCGCRPRDGVKPHQVRAYKATAGDPSDNIKGIVGFGEKSWEALGEVGKDRLAQALEHGEVPDVLPDKARNWIDANEAQFWNCYTITGFYDVPIELINANLIIGDRDYSAGDAILKRYFQ